MDNAVLLAIAGGAVAVAFAVALTLLVLDIKLPENIAYADNDALWARLLSLERHFVILCFAARWLAGEPVLNEELSEARWVSPPAAMMPSRTVSRPLSGKAPGALTSPST